MFLKPKVARSNNLPTYILEQIENSQNEMKKSAELKQQIGFEDEYKLGKMKVATASKKIAFIDHGFGVLENPADNVVWYRSGDMIYRKDDNHVKAVLEAIERGEPIEDLKEE